MAKAKQSSETVEAKEGKAERVLIVQNYGGLPDGNVYDIPAEEVEWLKANRPDIYEELQAMMADYEASLGTQAGDFVDTATETAADTDTAGAADTEAPAQEG